MAAEKRSLKYHFEFDDEAKYPAETDGENIWIRLPCFHAPEQLIEVISHEMLHASAPEEGTLRMPEWMIDEILSHLGLLAYQLVKSQAMGPEPVEALSLPGGHQEGET